MKESDFLEQQLPGIKWDEENNCYAYEGADGFLYIKPAYDGEDIVSAALFVKLLSEEDMRFYGVYNVQSLDLAIQCGWLLGLIKWRR